MEQQHLWLFTIRFPFGNGEAYLEAEVATLARRFDRITIVPFERIGAPRALPSNVGVAEPIADPYATASVGALLGRLPLFFEIARSAWSGAPGGRALWKLGREVLSATRQYLQRALTLKQGLLQGFRPGHDKLYSYWLDDQATVLSILSHLDPRMGFVSRVGGFDLYEMRAPWGWFPFRRFQLKQVRRVFASSQAGLDHLRERHPAFIGKFTLARLGTVDHGPGPWAPSAVLRMASCSRLVAIKRVDMLAEALALVDIPVEWTHFGDGIERDRIQAIIARLPANVRVDFRGDVPNPEVIGWYSTTPVDLFVHLSETEGGVPVVLQEAASFGIPLLACEAGGVREIVDERTGLLLPGDASPRMIADAIGAHPGSGRNTMKFRAGVREVWVQGFRAEKAYAAFAEELLGS